MQVFHRGLTGLDATVRPRAAPVFRTMQVGFEMGRIGMAAQRPEVWIH